MEFLSQANLDMCHVLFVFLSWSAPRSRFTSLLFDVQLKYRNGLIFNHGLNKVANRFGILKFLLAYNNNKIISENVGKSYFQLNFVHWTLAPGSWLPIQCFLMVANRCGLHLMSKMADVSLLLFVRCELSYNSGRNNSFHGLKIGILLFLLFSPKTT